MRLFIADVKKYRRYAWYSATAELKGQVAGSKLGWLWWIIEPLCFMLIYVFIYTCVFGGRMENLALFVFVGLTLWIYFSSCISSSVGIISSFSGVTRKTFIPKFILIWTKMIEFFVKMLISIGIILVALPICHIPFSWAMLSFFPLIICFTILIYGISTICAYAGVFISDLSHLMTIALRMLFYLSGIFYNTDVLEGKLGQIYPYVCPPGYFIHQIRDIIMYQGSIQIFPLIEWTAIGIFLCFFGTKLMYRGEKDYLKVV